MQPKILLVDDNDDLLLVTQIILKGQGYETFLAHNAEEALRKIKAHRPQLLLLDVNLGDADGRELCSLLRHDPETAEIRVILMSGDDTLTDCVHVAHDFLPKPFDFEELIGKVARQLVAEPA